MNDSDITKNTPKLKAWVDNRVHANLKDGELNTVCKKYHGSDLSPKVLASSGS